MTSIVPISFLCYSSLLFRRTLPLSTSPKCVSCRRTWRTPRIVQRPLRVPWTRPVAVPVQAVLVLGGRRQERSLGRYHLCTIDITLVLFCPQTPAYIRTAVTLDSRVIINFNLYSFFLFAFSVECRLHLRLLLMCSLNCFSLTLLLISRHVTKYSCQYSRQYSRRESRQYVAYEAVSTETYVNPIFLDFSK